MASDAPSSPSPVNRLGRWPKHFVWLGLLTTAVGFFSYFFFFFQFPGLRDFPIINLPLVLLGVILAAYGCLGVFKQRGKLGKSMAGLGMLLTLLLAGFFNVYIFWMSYQLPDSSEATASELAAPDFTLLDHTDQNVSLSDYRGKKVVLVFYRGNW